MELDQFVLHEHVPLLELKVALPLHRGIEELLSPLAHLLLKLVLVELSVLLPSEPPAHERAELLAGGALADLVLEEINWMDQAPRIEGIEVVGIA